MGYVVAANAVAVPRKLGKTTAREAALATIAHLRLLAIAEPFFEF